MTGSAFRIVLGCGLMICAFATGCSSKAMATAYPHSRTETLAQDPHEHLHAVSMSVEQDRRALAEDLDLLFMTDRPTRLTRWHSR
ncbi:MAG: hypothetical protein Q7R41_00810 [Phycisphaerales bacterium]|nr:hypothetical protein [Phycisphaerales bacterium]